MKPLVRLTRWGKNHIPGRIGGVHALTLCGLDHRPGQKRFEPHPERRICCDCTRVAMRMAGAEIRRQAEERYALVDAAVAAAVAGARAAS